LVLLLPAGQVMAADDPGPVKWPSVEQPTGTGTGADPAPVKWTSVNPPDNGGGNDPRPLKWPAPEQG
jgi:hypothetical protein